MNDMLAADKVTQGSLLGGLRFVTAASLFDGHDASINIIRRMLQASGVEVGAPSGPGPAHHRRHDRERHQQDHRRQPGAALTGGGGVGGDAAVRHRRHSPIASASHPAMKHSPPTGVTAPSVRMPVRLNA